MILKLILLAFIGLMLYKLAGGTLPALKKRPPRDVKKTKRDETKRLDENTLVECVQCGTYVTIKESVLIRGEYYCEECVESRRKEG
jgi:late competence protein required for DNA uptake (superfamily II DNA/RNA helicase)